MPDDQLPMKTSQQEPSRQQWKMEVSAILARLALHYWRPDFTPEQTKLLIADYLDDLQRYNPDQIALACRDFRMDGGNKFFPKSGELIQLIKDRRPPACGTRLQRFEGFPPLKGPQATKSVAQVLREHGYFSAAAKWEKKN